MKLPPAAALASLLLAVPALSAGPMETVRITISGGNLRMPVEITDPALTGIFKVYAGPGNFKRLPDGTRQPIDVPQGFIVDWSRGTVTPPGGTSATYTVSFTTSRPGRNIYTVRYLVDSATGHGYVYLPGKDEEGYADNVWMIVRGVEGHWFRAWSQWEELSRPFLTD